MNGISLLAFQGTNYDVRYPYMILLSMFVVGVFVMLFLPETLHQKLPETLREAEQFGKDQCFWYVPKRVHKPQTNGDYEHCAMHEPEKVAKDSEELEKLNQSPI